MYGQVITLIKRLLLLFLVVFMMPITVFVNAAGVDVSAQASILMEQKTGTIVYEKNAHKRMRMASTTKIMTGLIAVESAKLDTPVVMTDAMVRVEGTSMGLKAGDIVTVEGLLYGLLLQSGNDAANALAIHIAGSAKKFAERMNQKAAQIGMKESSFVTPSGLDNDAHYTTAYDMALLTCYAMNNPKFAEIVSSVKKTIQFVSPNEKRTYYNHNRLLKECDGVEGVKTGFTKKSGRCLVTSCKRNDIRLIAVTLNAPSDWNDHKMLYNFGFPLFEQQEIDCGIEKNIKVTGGKKKKVSVYSENTYLPNRIGIELKIEKKLVLPKFIYAPVKNGDVVGYQQIMINGKEVARVPVYAGESIEKKEIKRESFLQKLAYNFLELLSFN